MAERKARVNGQIIEIDPQEFDDDYRLCLRRIEAMQPGTATGLGQGGVETGRIGVASVVILYVAIAINVFFN